MNDIQQALKEIEDNRKPKKQRIKLPFNEDYRLRYLQAHKYFQLKKTPIAVKDHGYVKTNMPVLNSTSGITNLFTNYFNWMGHHAERVSNQGVSRNIKGRMVWTKGGGTNGSADVHGHFNSVNHAFAIPFKAEVKNLSTNDSQSNVQKRYERKVNGTGAIYCLIQQPNDVFEFYDYLMTL